MLSQFEIKLKKSVQSLENKIAKKILVKEPPPHKCVAAKEHGELVDLRACQGRAPPPPPCSIAFIFMQLSGKSWLAPHLGNPEYVSGITIFRKGYFNLSIKEMLMI